ncbi:glycoside hydrolase family 13 protein [Chitinophaga sancti]|uniref:Glycosidase n=1 Tax=Chitinophaga sancti TaxID=1004 RepID=A0A1K1QMG1_9BACT|nr:glycoside hydrolase family 13 protein [Chitinophaga sancti]WQD65096.1 glycoside hydrolase family 13 protein [Chitinophaga sancti]WQG89280.1 glycoside hydrolase family 13 protein [Chitinophaga sancti]SFW61122.1 Glycosidase [Chitinophaga sancti]
MKQIRWITVFLLMAGTSMAQIPSLERIEPANWWVKMQQPFLQLIVHGNKIAERDVKLEYPGVTLLKVNKVENPNYLFLDLNIDPSTAPGTFPIKFQKKGSKDLVFAYELRARNTGTKAQGLTAGDLIYLIMPDRFANGDSTNDVVKGMQETTLNRDSMYYRHGGDIQGIINHLGYVQDLGVTALWMTPMITNDQPQASYHGYAATEQFRTDPRYGTNELYKTLADSLHKRGMKLVMDLVHNHIGSQHWIMKDMPMKSWVHQWPEFTRSSFRAQPDFDPYASQYDKDIMTNGWFDNHMPDLDQSNPFVYNYFTQSHIWWIEYAGVDAFRLDTYPYNDGQFMATWGKAIKDAYPTFTFFGEVWVKGVADQVYFTQGKTVNQHLNTELPGLTDFNSLWAITGAMNDKAAWDDGAVKLYTTLASDYQYQDPMRNVVFLDNHDLSRFYSVIGENKGKYKAALAWLLTTRGIPQLYYGNEIGMKNFSAPDGLVREDFKGGWKNDKVNKFTAAGRNEEENELHDYVQKLANYRKNNPVVQTGKLMQYIPQNNVYTYFRYNADKTVMIILNPNTDPVTIDVKRFKERTNGFSNARDIVTEKTYSLSDSLQVPATTTLVLELAR